MKKTIKNVLALVFVFLMAAGSLSTFKSGCWTEVFEPEASPDITEPAEAIPMESPAVEATTEPVKAATASPEVTAATPTPEATQQPSVTPTPSIQTPAPTSTPAPSTPKPTPTPAPSTPTPRPSQKPAETPTPTQPPASTPTPHIHSFVEEVEEVWIQDTPERIETIPPIVEFYCACGFHTYDGSALDAHKDQYVGTPERAEHGGGGKNFYPEQIIVHPAEGHTEYRTIYRCSGCGETK